MTARARWLWLAGWTLAAALIYVLARGIDGAALSAALRRADARWLVVAMIAYASLQPVGALQWRALMPSGVAVSWRRLLTPYSLATLASNTTPSVIGHATGAALIGAEAGVGPAGGLSVIALDQVAVGVSKVVVLSLALSVIDAPEWLRAGAASLLVAVLTLGGALFIAARQSHRIRSWGESRPDGMRGTVLAFAARWAGNLDAMREPSRLVAAVACALAMRTIEGLAVVAVTRALGMQPSATGALVVLAGTSLATVIPFSPASLGTYEAGVYGAWRFLGASPETALAVAVLQHACLLVPAVGIGYVTLTVRRRV